MRNAGLCEVTISTVQRQAISSTVSGHGCLAIGELAIDPANHDRLSTAGASEALIGALKRHDSSIDVVINAGYAIHFLCGNLSQLFEFYQLSRSIDDKAIILILRCC